MKPFWKTGGRIRRSAPTTPQVKYSRTGGRAATGRPTGVQADHSRTRQREGRALPYGMAGKHSAAENRRAKPCEAARRVVAPYGRHGPRRAGGSGRSAYGGSGRSQQDEATGGASPPTGWRGNILRRKTGGRNPVRRRAGSPCPTGIMVHSGRVGQETRPYGAISVMRDVVAAPTGVQADRSRTGGWAGSRRSKHKTGRPEAAGFDKGRSDQRSMTPAASQAVRELSSQRDTCTSPMWDLPRSKHRDPGLADAAAHGQGQLPLQEHLMEGEPRRSSLKPG